MNQAEKEKMCVNCEGRIPFNAEVCPYCASDQKSMHNSFKAPLFQNQSLEDSLTSLYTPPYQGKRPQFAQPSEPTYSIPEQTPMYPEEPISTYKEVTERPKMDPLMEAIVEEDHETTKSSLWPTLLLLAGANFCIMGLMQVFFSKNGILRLEWDANYWFIYCILGIPLLYFGYRRAKRL